MNSTQEICADIVVNCDVLLTLLKRYPADNDSPEGRMVYQCRWLKEQAKSGKLSFPVEDYIHTLRYVSAERALNHLASSPQAAEREVETPMYRLLYLCDGELLYKPPYIVCAERCINALIRLIMNSGATPSPENQSFINELLKLCASLVDGQIQPPLMKYVPGYVSFIDADDALAAIPGAQTLLKVITNLIFEGVRPASWITPEAADRETASL